MTAIPLAEERLTRRAMRQTVDRGPADPESPAAVGLLVLVPSCSMWVATLMASIRKLQTALRTSRRTAYRDREKPRSSPLPHHRAYGSVHGGSAD